MKFNFTIVCLLLHFASTFINAQFFSDYDAISRQLAPPSPTNEQLKSNEIEQKYVNNGQSVLLVCDLPNQMPDGKVLFIKYDKILSSGSDIIIDSDDERFEIGQQYAWEWSLKINSINEDDAGVYFCKVGNVLIKQYEIIVRVPPRIKDDLTSASVRTVREGDTLQLACVATGVPKPNITWYAIGDDQKATQIQTGSSYLSLENLTRYSPRKYQCKASNNIPPSDTRNFSVFVEFAPEIEVRSKLSRDENQLTLNCTIKALPLTNRFFWRRDGNYIKDTIKTEIRNIRLNEFTLIAQLIIKQFNEMDHGLYECSGENDLRVSKVVYTVKERVALDQVDSSTNLMPIGYANNFRSREEETKQASSTQKNRKTNSNLSKQQHQSASLKEILQSSNKRPHHQQQRNNNRTKQLAQPSTTATTTREETTNMYNSPYIIILDEDETTTNRIRVNSNRNSDSGSKSLNQQQESIENKSNSISFFEINLSILVCFSLIVHLNLFISS